MNRENEQADNALQAAYDRQDKAANQSRFNTITPKPDPDFRVVRFEVSFYWNAGDGGTDVADLFDIPKHQTTAEIEEELVRKLDDIQSDGRCSSYHALVIETSDKSNA